MTNKSPVFPILPNPQHFSDYGFDPQIDYYQVLEEARRHKRETLRSIDALHFKLQKPISKEDSKKKTNNNKKKKWWRNALIFWRWKWAHNVKFNGDDDDDHGYMRRSRAYMGAISGPVYMTESRSGSVTPCRTSSRPTSGPLSGTLTPMSNGGIDMPYLSLRELNMDHQEHRISTSAMPIYLVT